MLIQEHNQAKNLPHRRQSLFNPKINFPHIFQVILRPSQRVRLVFELKVSNAGKEQKGSSKGLQKGENHENKGGYLAKWLNITNKNASFIFQFSE